MVKNMKLLVSSAFLSSFLFGNIAIANNPIIQLDREDLGIQGHNRVKPTAPEVYGIDRLDGSEWCVYQTPCLDTEKKIDEYMAITALQNKKFDEVGVGTYHPQAPGYRLQQLGRAAQKAAYVTWDIIEPVVTYGAVRAGGNVILSYVGPKIVEKAGNLAAEAAAKAFKYDYTGFAKKAAVKAARAMAEGEALRDLGTITHYVEAYGVPAVKTAYKATCAVGSVAYKATQAAYSWGKSWFSEKAASAA